MIGNVCVQSMGNNDLYSLNNRNNTVDVEACKLVDETSVKSLREKYNNSTDSFIHSGSNNVNFCGKNKNTDASDVKPKKSGFFKKCAVAFASSLVPGLGQAINGQWGKAAFYAIGAPILTTAAFFVNPLAAVAVGGLLEVANIVSAFRNA